MFSAFGRLGVAVVTFCVCGIVCRSQEDQLTNVHCFLPGGLKESSQREHCANVRSSSFCCLIAAGIVVSAGIAPALFLSAFEGEAKVSQVSEDALPSGSRHPTWARRSLNRLLSFSVGSLLGDVFLHLLPDLWNVTSDPKSIGLWTLAGLLCCVCIEKCAQHDKESQNFVAAVLNLVANIVDNFCHGLAIGSSFLVGVRFGVLTTFAILLHEIPHEIGDFALLLRAKLSRKSAVKAQLMTASFGVAGSLAAVLLQDVNKLNQGTSCWILPFCTGGFLNIALIQVLPDLLQDTDPKESAWHILLILIGIGVIGCLSTIHV